MRIVVVGGSGRVGAKTPSRNLLAAAEAAHVKHHIVLSIVGTDRLLESGYFRAKMREEDLARESLIPHTILRLATRDSRAVIADPQARYFGAKLSEDTLTPDEGAILGVGRFDDWLKHAGGSRALN